MPDSLPMRKDALEEVKEPATLQERADNVWADMRRQKSEIDASRAIQQLWRPIATAPIDDSSVLVANAVESCEAVFVDGRWRPPYAQYQSDYIDGVTHWMPLPEPPALHPPGESHAK